MVNPTSYKPGESILHKTDPRIKTIVLIFYTILIFMLTNFIAIGLLFMTILVLWKVTGLGYRTILSYVKVLTVIFVLLIVMQTIFYPGETVLWGPLVPDGVPLLGGRGSLTWEGFLFGMILCLRVLTLMCTLPLLLVATTIEELALGLVKMGLPYRIAFTATTALNQLPILRSDMVTIMNAQKLRGFTVFDNGGLFEKLKAFPALVVPLVMGSMRRATLMGVAMDSRAFGSGKTRTYIMSLHIKTHDWLFLLVGLGYGALLLFLNYFY